jgi:hypothetical protein
VFCAVDPHNTRGDRWGWDTAAEVNNKKKFDGQERRWFGFQRSATITALLTEHSAAIDE